MSYTPTEITQRLKYFNKKVPLIYNYYHDVPLNLPKPEEATFPSSGGVPAGRGGFI